MEWASKFEDQANERKKTVAAALSLTSLDPSASRVILREGPSLPDGGEVPCLLCQGTKSIRHDRPTRRLHRDSSEGRNLWAHGSVDESDKLRRGKSCFGSFFVHTGGLLNSKGLPWVKIARSTELALSMVFHTSVPDLKFSLSRLIVHLGGERSKALTG